MRKRNTQHIMFLAFISLSFLFIPSFLLSQYKYIHEPDADIYFGHISYTEVKNDGKDPMVIREGRKVAEVAVLNLPLAPGDTIQTTDSSRCEIQFDTGTIVRLDVNTLLTIETVLAQSLSSWDKVTNLVLHRGHIYIMYNRYSARELFQVKIPYAAVKVKNGTVAMVKAAEEGGAEVQVASGKVFVMYGPDEHKFEEKKVNKSQRLVISKNNEAVPGEFVRDSDFEKWNTSINKNFEELHKGKAFIPEPILKYPPAVVYFARAYSNLYGEWIWDEYFGWVWKPGYDYPSGIWQPYYYGMWREINGQLFWVPEEPWGWVPYHLGVWHWHEKKGWIWIPGSLFAPAWVAWGGYSDYYFWRPWSLWDWYFSYEFYGFGPYSSWGYYSPYWFYYDEFDNGQGSSRPVLKQVSKKQMQKKTTSPYPLPKEIKNAYRNLISTTKGKGVNADELSRNIHKHSVFVKGKDLNSQKIQEKIISSEKILKQREPSRSREENAPVRIARDPYQGAVVAFQRNVRASELENYIVPSLTRLKEKPADLRKGVTFSERKADLSAGTRFDAKSTPLSNREALPNLKERYTFSPGETKFSRSTLVFRDWNSDVSTARKMGMSITYSSRNNEIRCPELGISLRTMAASRGGNFSRDGFHSQMSSGSLSFSYSGSSTGSSTTGTHEGGGTQSGSSQSHSSGSPKGESGGRVSK